MEETENRKKEEVSEFVQISVTIPFSLLSIFDREVKRRGYTRSEAIRKAVRRLVEEWTGRRL